VSAISGEEGKRAEKPTELDRAESAVVLGGRAEKGKGVVTGRP
jgi:hypothetical protein